MPASVFGKNQVMSVSIEGLEAAQRNLLAAQRAVEPGDGLRATMVLATGQLHRYIIGQPRAIMRVRTGRLKNSIFPDVRTVQNEVVGIVATNVEYAPPIEKRYGFFRRGLADQERSLNTLFSDNVSKAIR